MNDSIIMKSPTSWHRDMYREAAPTGNGIIGAMVYGGIAQETVAINHCRLWGLGKVQELPDIHESLKKTREGIDAGDFWNANWISANALKEKNYAPRLGTPCPLCDLRVEMKEHNMFTDYKRKIHMDSGEVSVSWNEKSAAYERKLFVSRARDLIFYELTAKNAAMDLDMWLDIHETYEDDAKQKRESLIDNSRTLAEKNGIMFYAKHEDNTYYGAKVKIKCDGEILPQTGGKMKIKGASSVMVVIHVFVGKEYEEAANTNYEFLEEVFHYKEMLEEHKSIHSKLYNSARLSLSVENNQSNEELIAEAYEKVSSPALLERQWKFGRYLMICGTREDGLPFPLYGLWHGRYKMPWPHNMANENVEMIYWHTMSGGLFFATKTLIHYYAERIESFREIARKMFGISGIYMPAGTTPGNCYPNQIVPVILNWIGCAGWISSHMYQYYLYTNDKETLEKEILPFMTGTAEFYVNYLVKDETGTYKIYPSVSPENTPGNLIPADNEDLAHPCPSVVNATMDVAIIKELLFNLIKLTEDRNEYDENREVWHEILKHLPQYETTEDGDIKEWIYPGLEQRYNHRHLSHIYPVFPGNEIVKGRDDEEILKAFEKAVNKRVLGAQTGWSLAHMACIYARFEEPEKTIECLDILNKSCLLNNLFTLHNDFRGMGLTLGRGSFAPIQLDAAMGVVQALQEMLLYVGEDILKLLPALPKRLYRGSLKDFHIYTGTISMDWDMESQSFYARIKANRDTKLNVFLPVGIEYGEIERAGIKLPFKSGGEISIMAGEDIEIHAKVSL